MLCYKGFNKKLQATRGNGTYQYQIGQTYEEPEANCAQNGFHCVEEPLRVLDWYPDGRWCKVYAEDIHEDGSDKISCRKIKIAKELTLEELCAHEVAWIQKCPTREPSDRVFREHGEAMNGQPIVIKGSRPRGKGDIGCTIFLVKMTKKAVGKIFVFKVDGKEYLPDKWYDVEGMAHEKG